MASDASGACSMLGERRSADICERLRGSAPCSRPRVARDALVLDAAGAAGAAAAADTDADAGDGDVRGRMMRSCGAAGAGAGWLGAAAGAAVALRAEPEPADTLLLLRDDELLALLAGDRSRAWLLAVPEAAGAPDVDERRSASPAAAPACGDAISLARRPSGSE